MFQPTSAWAKFGEAPPVQGKVKCCFEKGTGFLGGRCLEMSDSECKLKQGEAVKDCKECSEREGGKRKKR